MEYNEIIRIVIALSILLIGFLLMRVLSRIIIKFRRATVKESLKKRVFTTVFEKIFFAVVLIVALFFLGFTGIEDFTAQFIDILPELLMFILLVILGILIVRFLSWIVKKFIVYSKLEELVSEDISKNILPLLLISIKVILYVILIEVIITIINIPALQRLTNVIVYPIVIIMFSILFVALLNPIRDFSSSFYLKNIPSFKIGNKIRFDDKLYKIKKVLWNSTELETEKKYNIVIPNRILAEKEIEFHKSSTEIQTLEELTRHFVAQKPSFCGPATAQIALSIFKIKSNQDELAKLAKSIIRKSDDQKEAGTHPERLIKAVEEFTNKKVVGSWIGFEKIYDLKKEISTWLNEGALIIIDYKKKFLFPEAMYAHYSLVVGIRGDEILIIDPSGKKGGVYFVDYRDVAIGMDSYSELIKGKRGYIVLAPKRSTGYERIKQGLIYHHPSRYDRISKNLEKKLNKLTSTPALLDMIPSFVRKRLKILEKEQISRLWKP